MTPEQQRIAIAEACGLIVKDVPIVPALIDVARCYLTPRAFAEYRKAYPSGSIPRRLPDYPNDLNAMHDAWKTCIMGDRAKQLIWRMELQEICIRDEHKLGFKSVSNATAAQRAEVLLRVLGKWK